MGREKWDSFLKTYFQKFAFKSMTTECFLTYLDENLKVDVDLKAWVYSSGLPENCPVVETRELANAANAAAEFLSGKNASAICVQFKTKDWTTHHWNHFLRSFRDGLPQNR